MILKALADYYERMVKDNDRNIAKPGFERKALPFMVVISKDGKFVNIRDTRTGEGKKKTAREFLVPQGEKRSSGIKANLLWDNPEYLFGVPRECKEKDKEKYAKRAANTFAAFRKRIEATFPDNFQDEGIYALKIFLSDSNFPALISSEHWEEIIEKKVNMSFILEGDTCLIAQRKQVLEQIRKFDTASGKTQNCSVSGKPDIPARLHTAIKEVRGARKSGANIVSFNLAAFRSFGKKQGFNAPIGQKAMFAYTTALNQLLRKGSNQRIQVGDASTVFWAKEKHTFETDFSCFLGEPQKGEEAISYGKIRSLLSAVKTGVLPTEDDMPFYVLGLAPNGPRIAVRFWYTGSIKDLKKKIAQHFKDIEIVRASYENEFLSIRKLLLATSRHSSNHPYGEDRDIVPLLAGDVFNSVLKEIPYPRTMLQKTVNRVKAEQGLSDKKGKRLENITYARAAIIKGFFVRNARFTKSTEKEVGMALDKENENMGYVLGRLFAVLERIQEQAQSGLNKTIRDTYFSAACSSPLVTFKRLQDLAIHHLAKIRNSGKSTVWLDKLLQEVMNHVPASGIPSILNMDDQGRFAIGYYHQRQDFFTVKETTEEKEKNNERSN